MYTAAGHVLTINGANKTASVRMDGLDLAVLTEEDGRRRLGLSVEEGMIKGSSTPCGPQTQVCLAPYADAAGEPQWKCFPANGGVATNINKGDAETNEFGAKICGPAKFEFSPTQCDGGRFEYKNSVSHVVKTGCQVVSFPYDMACYKVNC